MSTTTTTTTPVDLEALRATQQNVWSSGDYNKIAALTVPVAEALVSHASVWPGEHVLDAAAGTGHAALAAARQGARVTGLDYVPALLSIAGRRAAAEQLDLQLVEAPCEELPFADATFDVVLSAIGVMFAADHQRAASELVRVTRVGGRIALASWVPDSFVGGMLGIVGRHVPPPPGAQSPLRWGVEAEVATLLGDEVHNITSVPGSVRQRFSSAEEFADLFLAYYGPTHTAARRLPAAAAAAFRADLVAHANASGEHCPQGVVLDWAYRIVTAERKS